MEGVTVLMKVARAGATVFMAGALVFAFPVVEVAQADSNTDAITIGATALGGVGLIAPGALAGATAAEAGATAAVGTACVASVICGGVMVAIGVGALAYTTRDTWIPWIKAWGTGGVAPPGVGGWIYGSGYRVQIDAGGPASGGPGLYPVIRAESQDAGVGVRTYAKFDFGYTCRYASGTVRSMTGEFDPQSWATGETVTALSGTADSPRCGTDPAAWPDSTLGVILGYQVTPRAQVGGALESFVWGTFAAPVVDPATSTVTTNKVCQRPDGSQYTDSRSISTATSSIPVGYCLPGDTAVSVGVVVTPVGGSPIVTQALPLTPTPADVAAYPACGVGGCQYQILVDGVPCRVGVAGCSEWYAISQATPSRVSGRYGPYAYPLSGLRFMTHVYDSPTPQKITTGTATGTTTATSPNPVATAAPPLLTDPVPVAPRPLPVPPPSSSSTGDCWPTGAAMWNPVDWVFQPVSCALSWAFVPRVGTMTALANSATSDLTRVGIAPMAAAVNANLVLLGGDNSGCLGPAVTFSAVGIVKPMHPFSACDAPMSTLAGISHALATVGIIGIGGFAALRAIGAGFGFNVSMGRGKSVES